MADYDFGGYGGFPRYVSVGERRAKALLQARKLEKRGRVLEPVRLEGQRIASSFWGKEGVKQPVVIQVLDHPPPPRPRVRGRGGGGRSAAGRGEDRRAGGRQLA